MPAVRERARPNCCAILQRRFWQSIARRIRADFEYDLAGTPCERVIDSAPCAFESGIQERFPQDELLAVMGAHAYVGSPMHASASRPVGLVAALHDAPRRFDERAGQEVVEMVLERHFKDACRQPLDGDERGARAAAASPAIEAGEDDPRSGSERSTNPARAGATRTGRRDAPRIRSHRADSATRLDPAARVVGKGVDVTSVYRGSAHRSTLADFLAVTTDKPCVSLGFPLNGLTALHDSRR